MIDFKNKTKLIKGLPAIFYKKNWIIYSPYSKKIIVTKDLKNIDKNQKNLEKEKIFMEGKPSNSNGQMKRIILITTDACNLRCKYCYEAIGKTTPKNMSSDMAIKIIKDSISPNIKELKIIFFGGEPTLNFELIKKCVDYTKKLKIISSFQISTNGVVSTEILDYLIKNDFTIQISTDGIPKIQNLQRPRQGGLNSSDQVKKTILYLVKNNANFKIRMTITPYGLKYLVKSVLYFVKLGVKYVHIESVSSSGEFNKNEFTVLNYQRYSEEFIKVLKIAQKKGIKIINSTYMNIIEPSTKFCNGLCGSQIVVNPEGNISVCYEVQNYCHPDAKKLMVGKFNLNTQKIDIEKDKLKKTTEISVNTFDKCENCFAKFICSGGCPIRNRNLFTGMNNSKNDPCNSTKNILYFLIKEIYKTSIISK